MATGTVVSGTARKDATYAYASIQVDEGGKVGSVEYNAQTTLLKDDGSSKTGPEIKADLVQDVVNQRLAQRVAGPTPIGGVSGQVNV